MVLNYNFDIKYGMFKYGCITYGSYLNISMKDIEKIYKILNRLDYVYKQSLTTGIPNIDYGRFTIIFNFDGCIKIKNISNWLSIKEEIPIIKKELSKYIKDYNTESVKDIIIKIKSLKKGK